MQWTIHIPDDILEDYEDVMPAPEMGVLEAIAADAILAFLQRADDQQEKHPDA